MGIASWRHGGSGPRRWAHRVEIAEETAIIVTAETLRRTREEIEDAIAIAGDDAVARIEARYGGSFPIVPPSGTFDRPTLVIAGRQDSVLGFNDQWRIFGQWPRAAAP